MGKLADIATRKELNGNTMAITQPKKEKVLTDQLGNEFQLDFKDVSIEYSRDKDVGVIVLPYNQATGQPMELAEGIWWLQLKQRDLETEVAVNERIEGYPIDVAFALQLAVQEIFGIRELRSTPGFFGDHPPQFISVPVDATGRMIEIFLGRFSIPGAEGYLETSRDFNDALWIKGKLRQKSVPAMRTLIRKTKALLAQVSLYKGKAFRVGMETMAQGFEEKLTMSNPEFIDTNFMPADLMLNQDTWDLLTAALWTPIERTAQTRFFGVSLKRGVLLQGPYGTGKSLTALVTARLAQENGWTFIYLKDVNDLKRVYPFAARYAPSVIFAEDIDLVVKHEGDNNEDGINMLNNVLDGIDSKDKDIILVLTTNHIEQIPLSLLRPGRFDAMVQYSLPDTATAAALVKQYLGNDMDSANFNPERVGEILQGNQPATIHEIVKRAKLFTQQRYPVEYRGSLLVSTRDIELSTVSMQGHLDLLNKAPQVHPSPMEQFGNVMGKYMVQGVLRAVEGKDHPISEPTMRAMEDRAGRPAEQNRSGDREPVPEKVMTNGGSR